MGLSPHQLTTAHPLTLDVYTPHETRHYKTPTHPIETSVFLSTTPDIIRGLKKASPHRNLPHRSVSPQLSLCLSLNIVTGFYAVFHVSHREPIDCALRTVSAQHVESCAGLYLMRLARYHLQRTDKVYVVRFTDASSVFF
jgi:hypothetical protein